jgi:hypothetical protein
MALRSYGRCMGRSRLQGERGATVSCGDGSNFLFADHHDAGRLNRPIAGMVSILLAEAVYPLPPGPSGSEVGGGSNPAMTCNIKQIYKVCTLFVRMSARAYIGLVEKRGGSAGWI